MVDLPQPDSPTMPRVSPLRTEKDTSSTACTVATWRFSKSAPNREVLAQVVDQQQWLRRAAAIARISGHIHLFSLTSIALRNPSLIRLKHIEVMKIITPGSAAT